MNSSIDIQEISRQRASIAQETVRKWMRSGTTQSGVVLTTPSSVAWISGGMGQPIDRSAEFDPVWIAINDTKAAIITSHVEAERVRNEYLPEMHGFNEFMTVPWYDSDAYVRAAEEFLGFSRSQLDSDGFSSFSNDISDDLVSMRLALSPPERAALEELAGDVTLALEDALMQWRPGDRDFEIQSEIESNLIKTGAIASVVLVGGDERLKVYRHPVAVGLKISRMIMGVVVASRGGLHVALTRHVSAGKPESSFVELRERVLRIDSAILSACKPGNTYGFALRQLDEAYSAEGFPNAWQEHYQGGPIGFRQREFEIAPVQTNSRWYSEVIRETHAVAWNPSLAGGAKLEDTYLVNDTGVECLTRSKRWPCDPGDRSGLGRPAVLEI